MLALPFFIFLAVVLHLMGDHSVANSKSSQAWFIFNVVWLGLGVTLAFFVQSRFFKSYWQGGIVSPGNYIKGMLTD